MVGSIFFFCTCTAPVLLKAVYVHSLPSTCWVPRRLQNTWADHLIPGLIFFREIIIRSEWQQSGTRGNSVQVNVQNRRSVSPRIRSV